MKAHNIINEEAMLKHIYHKSLIKAGCILWIGWALSSCTGVETGAALVATSIAIIITEGKLPTDLVADEITGEDCNAIRRFKDKGDLCRPRIKPEFIDKPVYCYRTLGAVECYDRRDPYKVGAQMIE